MSDLQRIVINHLDEYATSSKRIPYQIQFHHFGNTLTHYSYRPFSDIYFRYLGVGYAIPRYAVFYYGDYVRCITNCKKIRNGRINISSSLGLKISRGDNG